MIRVETHRSQDMNRKEAMNRLVELLKAAWRPKARHAASRPAAPSASGRCQSARGDKIDPRQAGSGLAGPLPNARG